MRFRVFNVFVLAAVCVGSLCAAGAESAAGASGDAEALEAEIAYVEALVNYGYPDFAAPVIEATKRRWPASEARFFAIEIRGMLALGQFEAAEKKIAALPDRRSVKFWAARLEVANNHFGRGQKAECMKIYEEFFKVFPRPTPEIRKFYLDACYAYGQLLAGDGHYAKAAERYEALLKMVKDDEWCNLACETCDLYLKLIDSTDPRQRSARDTYFTAATKIADKLLWQLERPVYFGRAVSMKAHLEQMKGNAVRASELIDEYRPQLKELHDQIVQFDPDGRQGLLKQSPLPECLYLQAQILFGEAQAEYKKAKRDDERVKTLLFGPKKQSGKRDVMKGAFAMAQGVFLNYETSSWAPQAGELAEAIRAFAEEKYKAKIKTKVTPEQIARVRAAQFKEANEKFASGQYRAAIEAYYAVLAKYPEYPESIVAIENIASAYLDSILETKSEAEKRECRDDADAVEGYLAERFAGAKDKAIMIAAGDATVRLAAKEAEYRNPARADRLYTAFCENYTRHTSAANVAAARASEQQKNGRYADALKFWRIITETYTNASVYAIAHQKVSECLGKLGDRQGEIDWIERYLKLETISIRRLQAQMMLAQMYQKRGLAMLEEAASTNAAPEAVEAAEKAGTAQIIHAIKNFQGFSRDAAKAMEDPATPPGDREKYAYLREAAMFLVGDCWGRMNRPQDKVEKLYRPRAAEAYEAYLAAYPANRFSTNAYVRLGTIYTALGNLEKAKDALDALSKKFPDSDEAKNAKPRLAKSLIEMGLRKEGTEIYAEMLRTDGAYSAGQFLNAGEALVDAKSWELANQAYERAIRLAGTNSVTLVARARLGLAKTAWKQGSLVEAREALDAFLGDPKMSKMSIAAEANFMLVEIASEQGRTEKDATMRQKYFGAAIGALKKVRQYWKGRPAYEQDRLDLISGDVLVDRLRAEEAMGLKDEARETCAKAAAHFQIFVQAHGPTEEVPIDRMEAGAVENLERAYAAMVPLFAKLGAEQAERVMKFGQQYLDSFPNGKDRTKIVNCMNQAKADMPEAGKGNP